MKPGYKTTEFWLSFAAAVVALLGASGVLPLEGPVAQGVALVAAGLASAGYSWSRGTAKKELKE